MSYPPPASFIQRRFSVQSVALSESPSSLPSPSASFIATDASFSIPKTNSLGKIAEEVLKGGFIFKEGKVVKNWKSRYFELRGKKLYYYGKRGAKKALGDISLENAKVCEAPERNLQNCFKIITPKRNYFLRATFEKEMHSWMDALRDFAGVEVTLPDLTPTIIEEHGYDFDSDISDGDLEEKTDEEEVKVVENNKSSTKKKLDEIDLSMIVDVRDSDDESEGGFVSSKKQSPPTAASIQSSSNLSGSPNQTVPVAASSSPGAPISAATVAPASSSPTAVSSKSVDGNVRTIDNIQKVALFDKKKAVTKSHSTSDTEIMDDETDEQYDSDKEMFKMIQRATEGKSKKVTPRKKKKETGKREGKRKDSEGEFKDLFSYFVASSEQKVQQEKEQKANEGNKKKIVKAVYTEDQSPDYLEKAFKEISLVGSFSSQSGTFNYQKLDLKEIQETLRNQRAGITEDNGEDVMEEDFKVVTQQDVPAQAAQPYNPFQAIISFFTRRS